LRPRRSVLVGLLGIALIGCAQSPSGGTPDPSAASSPGSGSDAPAKCAPIDLRDPSGVRVDLSGQWAANPAFSSTAEVYLNQMGDCLFGSLVDGYLAGVDTEYGAIANLNGRLESDFTVDLDIAWVYQDDRFPYIEFSSTVLVIEWDQEGVIRLRENLEPGSLAGRCVPEFIDVCAPIVLTPFDGNAE
jgi:hypothetical protein